MQGGAGLRSWYRKMREKISPTTAKCRPGQSGVPCLQPLLAFFRQVARSLVGSGHWENGANPLRGRRCNRPGFRTSKATARFLREGGSEALPSRKPEDRPVEFCPGASDASIRARHGHPQYAIRFRTKPSRRARLARTGRKDLAQCSSLTFPIVSVHSVWLSS